MTETNAYRQRVVDGLIAAEVPELLATGIADMNIVLVWRVAAPIAAGRVDLNQHEPMHRRAGRQNIVDLAADIIAAANAGGHSLRFDLPGRVIFFCGDPGHCKFATLVRRDGEVGVTWQVERVGRIDKDRAAAADVVPGAAIGGHRIVAAEVDYGELILAALE